MLSVTIATSTIFDTLAMHFSRYFDAIAIRIFNQCAFECQSAALGHDTARLDSVAPLVVITTNSYILYLFYHPVIS